MLICKIFCNKDLRIKNRAFDLFDVAIWCYGTMLAMKRLAVRLPEPDMRRIKALAALRGVSLQEAVQQALEVWASQAHPGDTNALDLKPGSFAGADLEKPEPQASADLKQPRPLKRAATAKASRCQPAGGKRSLAPGGGQPHNLEGVELAWLRKAGTLDWSKCSAVESVRAKIGNVWVVRGTGVPVATIFRRFAEGQQFGEIAEALGLTQKQLKPVLQFAAEDGMFPRSAR